MKNTNGKDRFLQEYGNDGFKIIAAYEEACDIEHNDKFTSWFGDLGLFEAALNPNITYEGLCDRYKNGLKFLGIVNEQADSICSEFLSSSLAEHIREEKAKSDIDKAYNPVSIMTKRDVFELTEESIWVGLYYLYPV